MRATIGLAFALLWAAPAQAQTPAERLLRAYPQFLARVEGAVLVWRDGRRMPLSDGISGKSAEELLRAPDIDDMFAYPYPREFPVSPPQTDPGRIRNHAFFAAMYGDCARGEVQPNLVPVPWLPRHGGGRVMITRVNGVAERLAAVSAELDRLPETMMRYLVPSSGTYNCRRVAGTEQASAHGYGIAIDLHAPLGDYWRWSGAGYRNRIPREIVEIFERHGFIWGGKWAHFDTMHFEYRPELLP